MPSTPSAHFDGRALADGEAVLAQDVLEPLRAAGRAQEEHGGRAGRPQVGGQRAKVAGVAAGGRLGRWRPRASRSTSRTWMAGARLRCAPPAPPPGPAPPRRRGPAGLRVALSLRGRGRGRPPSPPPPPPGRARPPSTRAGRPRAARWRRARAGRSSGISSPARPRSRRSSSAGSSRTPAKRSGSSAAQGLQHGPRGEGIGEGKDAPGGPACPWCAGCRGRRSAGSRRCRRGTRCGRACRDRAGRRPICRLSGRPGRRRRRGPRGDSHPRPGPRAGSPESALRPPRWRSRASRTGVGRGSGRSRPAGEATSALSRPRRAACTAAARRSDASGWRGRPRKGAGPGAGRARTAPGAPASWASVRRSSVARSTRRSALTTTSSGGPATSNGTSRRAGPARP